MTLIEMIRDREVLIIVVGLRRGVEGRVEGILGRSG